MYYNAVAVVLALCSCYRLFVTVSNLQEECEKLRLEMRKRKRREIIDDALKTAETKQARRHLLEVKEESIKTKNELEKETKGTQSGTAAL